MKKLFVLLVSATGLLFFQACQNKEIASPVSAVSASANAVAANLKQPSPGNYTVKLYIENRDTATKQFDGYVFGFKANGTLTATADSTIYKGKWESKNNGTKLKLDIEGTDALKDVDKTWDVLKITNTQISLKDNQGQFGDTLVLIKNN